MSLCGCYEGHIDIHAGKDDAFRGACVDSYDVGCWMNGEGNDDNDNGFRLLCETGVPAWLISLDPMHPWPAKGMTILYNTWWYSTSGIRSMWIAAVVRASFLGGGHAKNVEYEM